MPPTARPFAAPVAFVACLAILGVLCQQVRDVAPALAPRAPEIFARVAARAGALIDRASRRGALWLHTRDELRAAERAHRAGDDARALVLAGHAAAEARLALAQARTEALRYARSRAADRP